MDRSVIAPPPAQRSSIARLGDFFTAKAVPGKLDGRWVILIVCGLYIAFVWFGVQSHGWTYPWRILGVPINRASFADGRAVLQGLDRYRHGIPISTIQTGDGFSDMSRLQVAYPSLWFYLLAPTGLGERNTVAVSVTLNILVFLCTLFFAGKLSMGEGWLYTILLTSPPLMMLVERGNVDLALYLLLVMACAMIARNRALVILGQAIIVLTAILKIYPITAVASGVKRRGGLTVALVSLVTYGVYVAIDLKELRYVLPLVPRSTMFSFGARTLIQRLSAGLGYPSYPTRISVAGYTALLLLMGWAALAARKNARVAPLQANLNGTLFVCGVLVLFSCFLVGNSYGYRLHYYLFLIPQLLVWARMDGHIRHKSRITLVLMILSTYPFAENATDIVWIGDLLCWAVLWHLIYLFTASMKLEIDTAFAKLGGRLITPSSQVC